MRMPVMSLRYVWACHLVDVAHSTVWSFRSLRLAKERHQGLIHERFMSLAGLDEFPAAGTGKSTFSNLARAITKESLTLSNFALALL